TAVPDGSPAQTAAPPPFPPAPPAPAAQPPQAASTRGPTNALDRPKAEAGRLPAAPAGPVHNRAGSRASKRLPADWPAPSRRGAPARAKFARPIPAAQLDIPAAILR